MFGPPLETRPSERARAERAEAGCDDNDGDEMVDELNDSSPFAFIGRSSAPCSVLTAVRDAGGGGATPAAGAGASSVGVRGSEPEDDVGVPESESGGDQADMRGVRHDMKAGGKR